jgi:hypothetical protein
LGDGRSSDVLKIGTLRVPFEGRKQELLTTIDATIYSVCARTDDQPLQLHGRLHSKGTSLVLQKND